MADGVNALARLQGKVDANHALVVTLDGNVPGHITGSGTAGQVAVFDGDESIESFAGFTFDGTVLTAPQIVATTSMLSPFYTVGSADTSGIRLDVSGGVLRVREGDGSAFATVHTLGLAVQSVNRLYLDGGSDTYIVENNADVISLFTGGAQRLTVSASGIVGATINATTAFSLNGATQQDTQLSASPSFTQVVTNTAAAVIQSGVVLADGAGVGAGTIGTAPTAGEPTKWIGINDNGTVRYVPAW